MNKYLLNTLDPGSAATGWTEWTIDFRAFSRPEHKVLAFVDSWDHGEYSGTEHQMCLSIVGRIQRTLTKYGARHCTKHYKVLSEGFELTQMIGGKDLLSPVRINAVAEWECEKHGVEFLTQARQMRTLIDKSYLNSAGLKAKRGRGYKKDEFAAMQHAVTFLRTLKKNSRVNPWKIQNDNGQYNWDCSCARGKRTCDLLHPLGKTPFTA